MSWYMPTLGLLEDIDRTNVWNPVVPIRQLPPKRPARSLGSASATALWRWASPRARQATPVAEVANEAPAITTPVRVTHQLRAEMAEMAHVLGRSEDDIWDEAAREWLLRRMRNDEPPPTTPAAAPVPNVRTRRMWNEIDAMLADLRHPRYVASPHQPDQPAA